MRTIIISVIVFLTACSVAPCEKDSFGFINFDNQSQDIIPFQIIVHSDMNDTIDVSHEITLESGQTKKVRVPQGIISLNFAPFQSIDLGLLESCEEIEYTFDPTFEIAICATCELVTEDATGNKTYGTPIPFCGDALTEKINSDPFTVGSITTYWICDLK